MLYNTFNSGSIQYIQTRRVKEYRRKSNYYEEKYESIVDLLSKLNQQLSDIKSNYGLEDYAPSYVRDDIVQYQYGECEGKLKKKISTLLSKLESKRDVLIVQQRIVYDLFITYYNYAIWEEYR